MAKIAAEVSLDMVYSQGFSGTVVEATSSYIEITDGTVTTIYYGQGFRYDSFGLYDGYLTSLEQFDQAGTRVEASELNASVEGIATAMQRTDLATIFAASTYGSDDIVGSDFADNLAGREGNDLISSGLGQNYIDGGSGFDYAVYGGSGGSYTIGRIGSSGITVTRNDGAVDDDVYNVERLLFDNGVQAFDNNAIQGYRLYQAAFDRTPDVAGLSYWVDELDDGVSLFSVAADFIGSQEFADLYGRSPSDEAFINLLYENVLNRQADNAGYDFWLDRMDAGLSRAEVLVSFSESGENQANVAGAVAGGVWLDSDYLF